MPYQSAIYCREMKNSSAGGYRLDSTVGVSTHRTAGGELLETFGERAKRLRKLAGLTQEQLASRSGLSQTTISNIETGRNASTSEVVALARALRVEPEYLQTGRPQDKRRTAVTVEPDRFLTIPVFNVIGAAGNGAAMPENETVIDQIRISRQWLTRNLGMTAFGGLVVISAYGDSMVPTFNDGDILLVDTSQEKITIDGVFVLKANDRLYIKRVRQRLDGKFIVSSDNPSAGTPEELNGEHRVDVLGRVVWTWTGKRL